MKAKHLFAVEQPLVWALVIAIGGGLMAVTPIIAQESSLKESSLKTSSTGKSPMEKSPTQKSLMQNSSSANMVAQATSKSDQENPPLEVVTHVDAMPPFTEKAMNMLREYRTNTLKESGNKRIDILQQVGRPNHFSIVEEWENQKSFNEHEEAPHTRKFRSNMQEALGAPFDERPHHFIAPSN